MRLVVEVGGDGRVEVVLVRFRDLIKLEFIGSF